MKYPWMPLFWGDFLANTMHLSAQEAGAYLFLIAHAWEHEGEIPADKIRICRIAHLRQDQWKWVWPALEKFFEPRAVGTPIGGYTHRRVSAELHRLGKISSNRKEAAVQMHRSYGRFAVDQSPITTSRSKEESSANGKARKWALGISPDEGSEYRSPPPKKSDNVLQPLLVKRGGQ